jgi:HK97 family phage prohead protease
MIFFENRELKIECATETNSDNSRTIMGQAVPWDVATTDSLGQKVMFKRGSITADGRAPKLIAAHNQAKILGVVTERYPQADGMYFQARLADTADGRDYMQLMSMEPPAIDAVSIGCTPTKYKFDKNGVMIVESATWAELSLVSIPAFDTARISSVQLSEQEPELPAEETEPMSESPAVELASPAIIPTTPIYATVKREFAMPSMGEYISKFVTGGAEFQEFAANIQAAAPNVTTGDLDGVLPTPVLAPVYNNFIGNRPVVDAFGGPKAMPAGGKVFIRPKVITNTSSGVVTQGSTITAGTFVVDDIQVTKVIYGGYVQLSEASIDWSSPEILNAMLDDMARIYANTTDNVAADTLVSSTTNTNTFLTADLGTPSKWAEWIYQASADILTDSNGNLPDTLFLAPDRWQKLGQLVDTSGRPLFPVAGPMNAFGTMTPGSTSGNAFGLRVVVDRNFASTTLLIGDASSGGYELWEMQKGAVSVENPSLLARTIAWRGYFAPVMVDATKFIKAVYA